MSKLWQVLPTINDDLIKKYPEYNRLILQLLFNRGLIEKDEIKNFLEASYQTISDPYLFSNMLACVEKIVKHIKARNKIVVYGDYDADGVTASAALYETLKTLRADVSVYIPDRVSEGYGLNRKAIDEIEKLGAKLIITVDGGIRNKEEVKYAKLKGVEVIITDHHVPPEKESLPECLINNPLVEGEKYLFKQLAGVGVAFQLARALIMRSNLKEEDKIKLEEKILDLVAVGTVADCVSLTGENRSLVKRGLAVLNKKNRTGLAELINIAGISGNGKALNTWNIGFQIAPRLNAAGRLEHANTAFELLITKDKEEAGALAKRLNDKNSDRQKYTDDIFFEVEKQIKEEDKIIIGVCPPQSEAWQEGVVGLVAGKFSEKYYRPCLIITRTEDGYKGSGRSIEEFNIMNAMERGALFLDKYGGHKSACGFSLKEENLENFILKMKEVAEEKLKGIDLRPGLKIDAEVDLDEINEELVGMVESFAPFGEDNERPKFLSRAVMILDIMNMGLDNQHLKLRLKTKDSMIINALGFWQAATWQDLRVGDNIDMVYCAEMNNFNGRSEVQLKIVDIKKYNANTTNSPR